MCCAVEFAQAALSLSLDRDDVGGARAAALQLVKVCGALNPVMTAKYLAVFVGASVRAHAAAMHAAAASDVDTERLCAQRRLFIESGDAALAGQGGGSVVANGQLNAVFSFLTSRAPSYTRTQLAPRRALCADEPTDAAAAAAATTAAAASLAASGGSRGKKASSKGDAKPKRDVRSDSSSSDSFEGGGSGSAAAADLQAFSAHMHDALSESAAACSTSNGGGGGGNAALAAPLSTALPAAALLRYMPHYQPQFDAMLAALPRMRCKSTAATPTAPAAAAAAAVKSSSGAPTSTNGMAAAAALDVLTLYYVPSEHCIFVSLVTRAASPLAAAAAAATAMTARPSSKGRKGKSGRNAATAAAANTIGGGGGDTTAAAAFAYEHTHVGRLQLSSSSEADLLALCDDNAAAQRRLRQCILVYDAERDTDRVGDNGGDDEGDDNDDDDSGARSALAEAADVYAGIVRRTDALLSPALAMALIARRRLAGRAVTVIADPALFALPLESLSALRGCSSVSRDYSMQLLCARLSSAAARGDADAAEDSERAKKSSKKGDADGDSGVDTIVVDLRAVSCVVDVRNDSRRSDGDGDGDGDAIDSTATTQSSSKSQLASSLASSLSSLGVHSWSTMAAVVPSLSEHQALLTRRRAFVYVGFGAFADELPVAAVAAADCSGVAFAHIADGGVNERSQRRVARGNNRKTPAQRLLSQPYDAGLLLSARGVDTLLLRVLPAAPFALAQGLDHAYRSFAAGVTVGAAAAAWRRGLAPPGDNIDDDGDDYDDEDDDDEDEGSTTLVAAADTAAAKAAVAEAAAADAESAMLPMPSSMTSPSSQSRRNSRRASSSTSLKRRASIKKRGALAVVAAEARVAADAAAVVAEAAAAWANLPAAARTAERERRRRRRLRNRLRKRSAAVSTTQALREFDCYGSIVIGLAHLSFFSSE
jgi:hypothetical protein